MQVEVLVANVNEEIKITVDIDTTTVAVLKKMIFEKCGVLPAMQRLIFGAEELTDDHKTLLATLTGSSFSKCPTIVSNIRGDLPIHLVLIESKPADIIKKLSSMVYDGIKAISPEIACGISEATRDIRVEIRESGEDSFHIDTGTYWNRLEESKRIEVLQGIGDIEKQAAELRKFSPSGARP